MVQQWACYSRRSDEIRSRDEWRIYSPATCQIPTSIVNVINFDNQGKLWTGHGLFQGHGGLWTLDNDGIENVYNIDNSNLDYNWVSQVVFDKNGHPWIGSNAMVFLNLDSLHGSIHEFVEDDFVRHNPSESGYTTNRIECMAFDKVNNLWVSTGLDADPAFKNEVAVFNGQKWVVLSREIDGFPNARVTDIIIDDNEIWMATDGGLIKVILKYE